MTYFISYNARYIASRKSLRAAVKFIESKGYRDDENNVLYIVAADGQYYNPQGEISEE